MNFFFWGRVRVGGGLVIVSKHFGPKSHTRKIKRTHKDFEPYQVFMQICCAKMLGYSFWSNGINTFCFGAIKTVYAQKITKEKLKKFRNIYQVFICPQKILTLSNHTQLTHTKSVFTTYATFLPLCYNFVNSLPLPTILYFLQALYQLLSEKIDLFLFSNLLANTNLTI